MTVFDNHHAPSESCNCDPNHTVYMSPEGFAEHIAELAWDEGHEGCDCVCFHGHEKVGPTCPACINPYSREGDQE